MTCTNAVIGGNGVSRVETFANLPSIAQDGDLYETLDDYKLWLFNASTSTWIPASGTVNITVSSEEPSAPGNEGDLWVVI
jgi:hypothetical protein